MIELTFLKVLMLIRQGNQKSVLFLDKGFKFYQDVCNRLHDIFIMSTNFSNIAILKIKSADYCFIFSGISKSYVVNVLQKAYLKKKCGAL